MLNSSASAFPRIGLVPVNTNAAQIIKHFGLDPPIFAHLEVPSGGGLYFHLRLFPKKRFSKGDMIPSLPSEASPYFKRSLASFEIFESQICHVHMFFYSLIIFNFWCSLMASLFEFTKRTFWGKRHSFPATIDDGYFVFTNQATRTAIAHISKLKSGLCV